MFIVKLIFSKELLQFYKGKRQSLFNRECWNIKKYKPNIDLTLNRIDTQSEPETEMKSSKSFDRKYRKKSFRARASKDLLAMTIKA